jgi:hypothetical protein
MLDLLPQFWRMTPEALKSAQREREACVRRAGLMCEQQNGWPARGRAWVPPEVIPTQLDTPG